VTEFNDAEVALVELARSLVGELANGQLLSLALAAQSEHSDAGRKLANVRWAKGPGASVGGRQVRQVFSHPQSPTVLYDLGDGHFAEGERGKAPGTPMHSPQFSAQALAEKGWQVEPADTSAVPSASGSGQEPPPASPGPAGPSGTEQRVPRRSTALGAGDRALAARNSEDALIRALASGTASDEQGTLDGRGQIWHPDRASVHNEIVSKHLDDAIPVPSHGRAILTGGMGHHRLDALQQAGAWKEGQYAPVCVHDIAEELRQAGSVPEVSGVHPAQSGVLAHREAAHVASLVTSALASRRKNLAVCGSMADPEHVRQQAGRLRNAGYSEIRGLHLSTPVDKAVRDARSAGTPAQAVLASALSHGADKSARGFDQAKEHLDGWEKWDHSGDVPVRKARGGKPPRAAGAVHSVEDLVNG